MTNDLFEDKIFIAILLPLMALMAPFLVWPIEYFLPYPYLIEELVKVVFILFILKIPGKMKQIKLAAMIGILFSLSETILYLFNFFMTDSLSPIYLRFILTAVLHSLTMITILMPTFVNKKLLPLGIIIAVLIHYLYNLFIL
ncbi:PrsW family intramembrane metalloprotease [Candidatus Roizmanbacteria bacterium]|nr:PrsW family intramembrane metalloprotease [Candidatus Roizmanbacteria bacterium]